MTERVSDERLAELASDPTDKTGKWPGDESGLQHVAGELALDLRDCRAEIQATKHTAKGWLDIAGIKADLRAAIARAEQERDEAVERCGELEDAVRENLPEVTGDADGNLETNEVCRIETVGLLYRELEEQVAALRDSLRATTEGAEAERQRWAREHDRASKSNDLYEYAPIATHCQHWNKVCDTALALLLDTAAAAQAFVERIRREERERCAASTMALVQDMAAKMPELSPAEQAVCTAIQQVLTERAAAIRALGDSDTR